MKILIVVNGWIGDILLTQPSAKLLKEENQASQIDFLIGFPQPYLLLKNNPHIDNVFVYEDYGPFPKCGNIENNYDEVRFIKPYDGSSILSSHHQLCVGVKNPNPSYKVYTLDEYDKNVQKQYLSLPNKPIIGVGLTWKTTSRGGFYDPNPLIEELSKDFNIIPIGKPHNMTQKSIATSEPSEQTYAFQASLCKYLDVMIGSEGGLTNLASGVGTKVIYTTDFIYDLAGPNGSHYQIKNPLSILGPKSHFPDVDHHPIPKEIFPEGYMTCIKDILNNIPK